MASWSGKSQYASLLNRKTLSDTPTTTTHRSTTALASSSSLFKSVCLHDWWITTPPDGQHGLAVAGFSSRDGKSVRAFQSAVISKRHDATTLETVDGFTVALIGNVNKDLTHQNGFSPEVSGQFHFGFPYNWEKYFVKHKPKTRSRKGTNDSRTESLDNIPGTNRQDPFMRSHKESDCCVRARKAMDDLFECLSKLEHDESSASQDDDNANLSEAVKMSSNTDQPTNLKTCVLQERCLVVDECSPDTDILGKGSQSKSYDVPIGSRKPGPESGHTVPTKKKIGDPKMPEGLFVPERFISDSASAKMTVTAETLTTLKTKGISGTIGNMPTVGHGKPTKSKTVDTKMAEGSFLPERIDSASASAKMTVTTETPTTLKTDGTSGTIGNMPTVGHAKPTKSKTVDKEMAEGSFFPERINSPSATSKMTASAETPTILKVDSTSRSIGKKHSISRKITRSMTKG